MLDRPSRLLFCWELGANFGHLSTIAPLQERLAQAGLDVAFAVSDLRAAREILGEQARLFQSPSWPNYEYHGSRALTASFGDILTRIGFAEPPHLAAVVDAWLSLIQLFQPSVMVADHSPGALLAARVAGVQVVAMGSGFTMPPLDYEAFPLLRNDIAPALPEPRILSVAQQVLADRGAPSGIATLPELFRTAHRLVIGLPELDPYRSYRREFLLAPTDGFAPPVKRDRRLFAYLGTELPGLVDWVKVIADLPVPVDIYVRGADPMLSKFLFLRGKNALRRPGRMQDIFSMASHVISQGGAMLASEALAAGRPHFFIPVHAETQMNAAAVTALGCGQISSSSERGPEGFAEEIRNFLGDEALVETAFNTASLLTQRPLMDAGQELLRLLLTPPNVQGPTTSAAP